MSAIQLTKEEERLILKKRKEADKYLPKKIGFLKHDLYSFDEPSYDNNWIVDEKEKTLMVKDFLTHFELAVPAGSKFVCFINEDDREQWFDDVCYGIEGMPVEWAKKHLKNIERIKKEVENDDKR